jgi:inositol-phosphate phosphatase/L-galactose 1-phosphate phosphatase/histidinol-phosphatase
VADRAVETLLRHMVAERYPDHGVIGEEFSDTNPDAEYVWVFDPIDGTRSFIIGIPLFTTLISLVRNGSPVLGVIDQPVINDRWVGGEGRPATFNGKPARVRDCGDIALAQLCTSNDAYFKGAEGAAFERLRGAVRWAHQGADAYGFGLIASGLIDLGFEAGLGTHDYCALAPIIEAAGGIMTDWHGDCLTIHSDGRVLAAGDQRAHAAALALIAG